MSKKNFTLKFAHELARKYAGKFVAVVNEKVVATGENRLAVFRKAERAIPSNIKIGIFYFPTKKEMLTAL